MIDYVVAKFPRSERDFVSQKYSIKSRCLSTFHQSCKGMSKLC